ncbi:MAG: thiamine pyrophosphate-dependent enzyme [Proteobacteria bacterium]|nr:thiamine pyrophosphate-dependent enzyme [Pseudomonadota bacterium]
MTACSRRDAVGYLLNDRDHLLVVAGLGAPAWDCAAVGDHEHNFYLWGGMGSAAMVGLGLALAQPSHSVLVITGDGEMLMGLSSLATIAVAAPRNLTIVVLDNERYGETGMQQTHTAYGCDLTKIADGAGFAWTALVRDLAEIEEVGQTLYKQEGPGLAVVKVTAEELPLVLPPRDGALLKDRFRKALLIGAGGIGPGNESSR